MKGSSSANVSGANLSSYKLDFFVQKNTKFCGMIHVILQYVILQGKVLRFSSAPWLMWAII